MKSEQPVDNYHYLSIMIAVASTSPDFYFVRFMPPEYDQSALCIVSKDNEIFAPMPLRSEPTSATQFQKEAYEIVQYAYNHDENIKYKDPRPITNDRRFFERTVDLINSYQETHDPFQYGDHENDERTNGSEQKIEETTDSFEGDEYKSSYEENYYDNRDIYDGGYEDENSYYDYYDEENEYSESSPGAEDALNFNQHNTPGDLIEELLYNLDEATLRISKSKLMKEYTALDSARNIFYNCYDDSFNVEVSELKDIIADFLLNGCEVDISKIDQMFQQTSETSIDGPQRS